MLGSSWRLSSRFNDVTGYTYSRLSPVKVLEVSRCNSLATNKIHCAYFAGRSYSAFSFTDNMGPISAPGFTARLRSSITLLRNVMNRQLDLSLPLSLFPTISVVFFILLWVVMFRNGSVDSMNLAIDNRELAPGQPLQVHYTGIPPVDNLLVTLVAFTYPVTSAEDKPSMLLMVDIVSTLQTALLWAHLDNNRVGRKTKWLA